MRSTRRLSTRMRACFATSVEIQIDRATPADVKAMLDISNAAAIAGAANFATEPEPLETWAETFRDTQARHPWLVARLEGGIVGFAKSSPHRSRGAYAWSADVSVYVAYALHRRGVGTRLYAGLLPMLARQGYVTAIAGITSPNEA